MRAAEWAHSIRAAFGAHPVTMEASMSRSLIRAAAALGVVALGLGLAGCQTPAGGTDDPSGDYVTDGKLTIATGEPAYYPYVIDDAPESGEGFEAAVAYAVAEELGFAADDVVWVRTGFEEAIAPGAKDFDFNIQQFTISDERREAVDFSTAYYETTQVVITTAASPAAGATSIADLKDLLIGAAVGTTSFDAIEQQIQPTAGAQVFNTNDDAKLALESGQVDAIVVDLPTAFYLTGVELTDGLIIGQLPQPDGKSGEEWGLVLEKDSPLTDDVTAAVDALRENGTLADLAAEWLSDAVDAPVLQ
jgi:polar amino acid transport system substrate-binding protein